MRLREIAMIRKLSLCRIVTALALLGGWLTSVGPTALAQGVAEADTLNKQAIELYRQGKYGDATALAKRALAIYETARGPDHPDVGTALNNLAFLYRVHGRYAEAEPLYKRSLAIREKALGPEHPDVGTTLNNLAELYRAESRYAEAEPLYKRSLAIREKALGPDHADFGAALNNLATLYRDQGRYAEAEPLYQRGLSIFEKARGPDHADVGIALNNLADLYRIQGRYAQAELLYKRSLAIREKTLGPNHAAVSTALSNLAELYRAQGRHAEAEPLYKRSLVIREGALGPDHSDVGIALNNLAILYRDQGRYVEAEPLYQRSLAIREKALGPDHPAVGTALNNLAALYRDQGRYAEAEPLYQRSLAIREKALGPDHPDVGGSLNTLAGLYRDQGRYAEAEPFYQRSLTIFEKALGPNHPSVGIALNNLALLYRDQGRYAEAEPLFQRSLTVFEKALGLDHPEVGTTLNNLALVYESQGRYAETEALFKRSLAIRETALGPDHPQVGASLSNLAALYFAQRDWARAAEFWRRSTSVIVRRTQRGTADLGKALTGRRKGDAEQSSDQFLALVKAVHRLGSEGRSADRSLQSEMFQIAQWAHASEAAASLAQMSARGAKGDVALSRLVRERQDLVEDWQKRDAARSAAVSQEPSKRDRAAEAVNAERLAAIDARIAEIDKRLLAEFPDYAVLARPTPLSVEEVQAQLGADEALVLFLDTPEGRREATGEETFIWVVTKTDMRGVRSDLGTVALGREVSALRCGLDAALWDDEAASVRCREQLKAAPERDAYGNLRNETLPFARARAHALYKALFGEVEDMIRDKHLLIVPSGPLTQLPFHVLVTAPLGDGGDYRATKWLAGQNAITVLPAVASLKALRRVAKASAASKPMLGVGNPLLDGDPASRPWEAKWAQLARDKQACSQTLWQRVAGLVEKHRSVQRVATRGGRADLDHLRSQSPLHDTADELCAVAKDLRLSADDILLGAKASEAALKTLSDNGKLAQYRVVHFATHGTIAGDIEGTSEPGLILTPPKESSDLDDGYLSASEVAALKLDADWVILSACNTAAGGATGAEALSGLARAFIYAGARALLVSHWSVSSEATVSLITHAVGAISHDKKLGRAEALRRAMLAMIDKGKPHEAHPAYWAPFVVVGEGAAAK
jgi:tetratricopeptide (TPR) repeat protein/CHAT domain-containing protein